MPDITHYIAAMLAHSMVYFTKLELSPGGIVDDARCGGDPPAPNIGKQTAGALRAEVKYLPQLLPVLLQQIGPQAMAELEASKQTSPAYAQLAAQLQPYINDVSRQQAQGDVATDVDILGGSGQRLAALARQAEAVASPELFAGRQQVSQGYNQLLGGMDPNHLSGAEQEAIQRGVLAQNQATGNTTPNATTTTGNALMFGQGLQAKQQAFGRALESANSFLTGGAQPTFNPVATALGKTRTNPAAFGDISKADSSQAFGLGNNAMQGIMGLQGNIANINANRRDSLDRLTEVTGSMPSYS